MPVLVLDAEVEPVDVLEADVDAVAVAVGVSDAVTEPLAVGDADFAGLTDSRGERDAEPEREAIAVLVPFSHTSLTCPPMAVAEARMVGDGEGASVAVAQGVAVSVALAVPVARAVVVGRVDAVPVLVAVPLAVPVLVPVPPLPVTDTEEDREGLGDVVRDTRGLADTDGDAVGEGDEEVDADTVEVFDSVAVEDTDLVGATVLVAELLDVEAGDWVGLPTRVAVPPVLADAAGEPLTLGEGVALREAMVAVPVEETETEELEDVLPLPEAAALPVLATVRVGSHTEAVGVDAVVREKLGEGVADGETRPDGVNEPLPVEDGVLLGEAESVGEPVGVLRGDAVLAPEAELVALRDVRTDGDPVFASQLTVDVAVVDGDPVAVRVSLNSPMVIVGDVEMDAVTDDVDVLEDVVVPVAVVADVGDADCEVREDTVALEDAEGVAEAEPERDASDVGVFDEVMDAVCLTVALPPGLPLPGGAALGELSVEEDREDVEDFEGHTENVTQEEGVTEPSGLVDRPTEKEGRSSRSRRGAIRGGRGRNTLRGGAKPRGGARQGLI